MLLLMFANDVWNVQILYVFDKKVQVPFTENTDQVWLLDKQQVKL